MRFIILIFLAGCALPDAPGPWYEARQTTGLKTNYGEGARCMFETDACISWPAFDPSLPVHSLTVDVVTEHSLEQKAGGSLVWRMRTQRIARVTPGGVHTEKKEPVAVTLKPEGTRYKSEDGMCWEIEPGDTLYMKSCGRGPTIEIVALASYEVAGR